MKTRRSCNFITDSDGLNQHLNTNVQPLTSNKTKVRKRRSLDPKHTPPKHDTYKDEVRTGLHTPRRTPPKEKNVPDDASSPKDIACGQSFKRRKLDGQPNKMAHCLAGLVCDPVEETKNNNVNVHAWHQAKSLLEAGLSIFAPTSDILTVTHDNKRSFSEPTGNLSSPLPEYSENTTVDSEKAIASKQLVVRKRSHSPNVVLTTPQIKEEIFDDSDFRVSQTRHLTVVFSLSVEKARRWADAIDIPEGLYNEEEKDLFFRLAMRGFEPLIPEQWRSDFPTLPYTLFSDAEGDSRPVIHTFKSSKTYAIRSLAALFSLGGRVRDCRILKKGPEILIKTTISQYFRWALRDTDIHINRDAIPVHVIYAKKKGETTLDAVKKLNLHLQLLASRHREALSAAAPDGDHGSINLQLNEKDDGYSAPSRFYPLLIGFIICGPIIAILTLGTDLSSTTDDTDSKYICQFDLEDAGHDVWNSLAVAITVMKIRETMMQLVDIGSAGFVRHPLDTESTPDVDS
ncbi:hypothetical protein F9C07_8983 [Aspergillus flavus]|uniref:Uncharacterized protein n=2 Tax=Aspergillus subgen. Circumdati TaxID=2720871 RepID=A0A7U2MJ75_ASPFN|nr:hypothetical protein Ao3042_11618 [Aspergillus oryzae 3.042]KDE83128.1 hypothetical protein AO1008_09726 [Aspergillus oryzae 100-8]QRD84729.1 hypothetical protein F9C07_8983 [Aspergillus flavus]|eukprot:EIT83159.1 hypothetical protein Ao3042_11618 [Aspergillus oryzae 3.042]